MNLKSEIINILELGVVVGIIIIISSWSIFDKLNPKKPMTLEQSLQKEIEELRK